jgi:hypothetical protein
MHGFAPFQSESPGNLKGVDEGRSPLVHVHFLAKYATKTGGESREPSSALFS